jgi:serine protease Do
MFKPYRGGILISACVLTLALLFACTRSPGPGDDRVEYTDVIRRVFPSIVRIEAIREGPNDGRMIKAWVAGSGVVISREGHVLTNAHVATDADFFRCYLYDGEVIEARLVGEDPMTDLAVLQLDLSQRAAGATPLYVAPFGDSDTLDAGHTVFALGSPGFLSQSVTRGIVANPSMVLPEQTAGRLYIKGEDVGMLVRWILHDAPIFGGNSGGPLVNADGEVIGINEIGVFSLSGAIPGNLAREVASEIVERGRVIRGWSGMTVQARLKSSGSGSGVVVSDVAPDSPADDAGVQPGDVVISYAGRQIEDAEEKAIAHFYQIETSIAPGRLVPMSFQRDGTERSTELTLSEREPAQTPDVQLDPWGAVVRDLTADLSRNERLPERSGVWFASIRPGGPSGQAEPNLNVGDILIAVDGQDVSSVEDLRRITGNFDVESSPGGVRTVLATFRRDGAVLNSVVELRLGNPRNTTPSARRAWLGAASQPLTAKLATSLGVQADGGVRVTRIYPGTKAADAGLQVGDVILALDNMPVLARRPEDADILNRTIRNYRADTIVDFSIWRNGSNLNIPVTLEAQPVPASELAFWEDDVLEFEVRNVAFEDRVRLQIPPDLNGVLVGNVVRAGWAALAELRANDVILEADGRPVTTVSEFREARDSAIQSGREWLVLLVQRRAQTQLVEITLKPASP